MVEMSSSKSFGAAPPGNNAELHEAGLEFPDWSGMVSHKVRMGFAEAVQWNEDILFIFPQTKRRTDDARNDVEFVL